MVGSVEEAMTRAHRVYRDVEVTGDLSGLDAARAETDEVLRRWGSWPDAHLLRAQVHFAQHRLGDARRELEAAPGLASTPLGRALLASIDLEDGRYEEARRAYQDLVRGEPGWDDLARMAHYHAVMGDSDAADHWYSRAEDELTAKQMRSYAWVEAQRGLLDLWRGRYDEAAAHYELAGRACPDSWVVKDHCAELMGARGEFEPALLLYEEVASRVPRPELQQTLGDLAAFTGRTEQARTWHDRALAGYLASVERGEVYYLHHLADLTAGTRPGPQAVEWARRDLELRRGYGVHATLAWALHRVGRVEEAVQAMDSALASGARNAQLLSRAAAIQEAARRSDQGRRLRKQALAIDPHLDDFRAHR